MSLTVDGVVSVQMLVAPQAPVAKGFGTLLLLGTNSLPLEERIRQYTQLTDVAADFATNTEEYKAATAYFSQSPAPALLMIGNRFTTAQAGKLRGSAGVSAVYTDYTGITNGGFDVTVNGTLIQVTALNLSGAASMAAIAALIQTKLAAGLASTTCTWTGNKFVITSPTTGTSSVVSFAAAPTGAGAPVDVSATLGFTAAAGALPVAGIALENMAASWAASDIFAAGSNGWYGMALTATASVQDNKDSMAYAEANKKLFFYTTSDPNAELSAATTDLGYYAKNLTYNRSAGQFSSASPYAGISMAARLFIVDYSQPNSTITVKFKQEPGVTVEPVTSTQAAALKGKNLNYYVDRGGFAMVEEGVVANGRFIDEVIGLDWLQATIQNAVYTALATSVTKIPQTDAGAAVLVQAADLALSKGVLNGLLAPGIWTGQALGTKKSGDLLETGYYVFAQAVKDQLPADRAARKAPAISAICIGAGAIHSCAITVTFQR